MDDDVKKTVAQLLSKKHRQPQRDPTFPEVQGKEAFPAWPKFTVYWYAAGFGLFRRC